MPAPVLTTPVAPSRTLRAGYSSRATVIEFGDGYEQASAGPNAVALELRVTWRLLWADADALLDFLAARAGVEAFEWVRPGDVSARLWRCGQWDDQFQNDLYRTVTAQLREVQA